MPASLLERVRALPSVEEAAGSVQDETATKILKPDGKAVNTGGAPSFGLGIDPAIQRFNPLRLVEGTWAQAADEVVIDEGTAEDDYGVGETVRIATLKPVRPFRVVGIARYGEPRVARDRDLRRLHDSDGPGASRPAETSST